MFIGKTRKCYFANFRTNKSKTQGFKDVSPDTKFCIILLGKATPASCLRTKVYCQNCPNPVLNCLTELNMENYVVDVAMDRIRGSEGE